MPRKIQSDFNAQLKKVRGLYRRANRVRFDQGVAEGPQAVRELVTARPDLVRDIYATELALASHPDIARAVVDADFFLHVLPDSLFSEITDTGQGILGVYTIPDEPSLDDVLSNEKLVVMGLGTSDPGNAGTIMRSADGAGAGAVIFSQGSVECSNPKVVRASTGSYFHIPFIEDDDAVDVVLAARSYGFQVLIADAGGEMDLARLEDYALLAFLERHSEALARDAFGALLNTASDCDRTIVDLSRPTLWVFGNEAHGFTADELKLADARVRVPMWGNTESLNLGVAASLCIFASAKAQHRAH